MKSAWIAIVLLCACGDEAKVPDAMPDAMPRCDRSAPFGAPVPVGGLNTADEESGARFSPDELVVVFARLRSTGFHDLYTASRTTRDAAFDAPSLLATVNSVNRDIWPTLSPDGLLLAFGSNRSTGNLRIYTSRRPTTSDPFAAATAAPALMDADEHPYLANERALYFSAGNATRPGVGGSDLWRAEIDSTGATGTPVAVVGGVNTADEEVTATLTADELHIYFRRTVAGEPNIFTASRSTMQDGFGPSAVVPGLDVVGVNEVPNWVSPDDCALYFNSNAPGGSGMSDIYVATRGGF